MTPNTQHTPTPCNDCGKRPKEQIWAMEFSDKDDEFYLVHWCSKANSKVFFPRLKKSPFTAYYLKGQRPLVISAWNEEQAIARAEGKE